MDIKWSHSCLNSFSITSKLQWRENFIKWTWKKPKPLNCPTTWSYFTFLQISSTWSRLPLQITMTHIASSMLRKREEISLSQMTSSRILLRSKKGTLTRRRKRNGFKIIQLVLPSMKMSSYPIQMQESSMNSGFKITSTIP